MIEFAILTRARVRAETVGLARKRVAGADSNPRSRASGDEEAWARLMRTPILTRARVRAETPIEIRERGLEPILTRARVRAETCLILKGNNLTCILTRARVRAETGYRRSRR